jgi:hypothetical protein
LDEPLVSLRLTEDYNLLMRLNTFVQAHIAAGHGLAVLKYVRVHFARLEAAEKECGDDANLAIWRMHLVQRKFIVEQRCYDFTDMCRFGLCGPLAPYNAVQAVAPGGARIPPTVPAVRNVGTAARAPALGSFRSHATNLAGQAYTGPTGQPYNGAVCDRCEKGNVNFFHHPLRCDHAYPGWNIPGNAPEQRTPPVTTWYVRPGGKPGSL